MGFITGKKTSSTTNQAFPFLKGALSGAVGTGTGAMDMVSRLLMGGDGADAALKQFQDSTGYQSVIDGGSKAITGNAASRGLLRSGSTGKALVNFGQDAAKSSFQGLVQNLLGLGGQGIQAANVIGGAGQVSKSKEKPGLGPTIGAAMSMIPSDSRLKTDIKSVGVAENGLGIYKYRYKWDDEDVVRIGYMADEVKDLVPDALGPELPGGYMTVDYSKLPPINTGEF